MLRWHAHPPCSSCRAAQQQGHRWAWHRWQNSSRAAKAGQLPGSTAAGVIAPCCLAELAAALQPAISTAYRSMLMTPAHTGTSSAASQALEAQQGCLGAVRQCEPACLLPVQRGVPDLLKGAPWRRGRVGWRRQGCARGPGLHCGCCGPCPDAVTLLIPGQAGDGLLLHSQELAGPASNLGPAPRQALTHIHVHAGEWRQGPIAVQGLQSCAKVILMAESIIWRARVAS